MNITRFVIIIVARRADWDNGYIYTQLCVGRTQPFRYFPDFSCKEEEVRRERVDFCAGLNVKIRGKWGDFDWIGHVLQEMSRGGTVESV